LLYFYFSKIEKSITSNGIRRDQLKKDVLGLITAAPIGRGWLLIALVDKDGLIALRLDTDEGVYFDEEALARLPKEGMVNIFYLSHNN